MRIGLMGFGRIGRNVFRLLHGSEDATVAGIADTADPDSLAYLLKYDSLFGRFPDDVSMTDGDLLAGQRQVPLMDSADPGDVDWAKLGVEVVVQATGRHKSADWCRRHLDQGAKYVVLASTPDQPGDIPLVLWGINESRITADLEMVALGSNTSNALAPILEIIDGSFGIDRAFFTTVHAFTNEQRLADVPSGQFRGSRAAGENIIPNATNSAQILAQVMPVFAGKLSAMALNVPVADGSTIDLTAALHQETDREALNSAVREAVKRRYKSIVEYSVDPIVSSDVTGTHSGVFDSLATMVMDGTMAKCIVWFDNGWGYAARVVDTIHRYRQFLEGDS